MEHLNSLTSSLNRIVERIDAADQQANMRAALYQRELSRANEYLATLFEENRKFRRMAFARGVLGFVAGVTASLVATSLSSGTLIDNFNASGAWLLDGNQIEHLPKIPNAIYVLLGLSFVVAFNWCFRKSAFVYRPQVDPEADCRPPLFSTKKYSDVRSTSDAPSQAQSPLIEARSVAVDMIELIQSKKVT